MHATSAYAVIVLARPMASLQAVAARAVSWCCRSL